MNRITLSLVLPLVCTANIAMAQQDCGLADLDPIALDKDSAIDKGLDRLFGR